VRYQKVEIVRIKLEPFNIHLRSTRYLIAVATAIVGTLLSAFAFVSVSNWDNRLAGLKLQELAKNDQQTLNSDLQYATEVLYTLRAYYNTHGHTVSRSEFQAFAKDLRSRLVGLRNTGWALRVTREKRDAFERSVRADGFPNFEIWERDAQGHRIRAADRAEYFPILYPDPVEYTSQILGFDISSEPIRADALRRARASEQPAATPPINLITKAEADGFMTFIPLYPKDSAEQDMPHTPAGFMYGVFGTAPMIENILGKKAIPSGLDIYFFNLNGDPRNRHIYWHSSQANSAPSAVPSEDALLAGPHWMGHIRIADQEWGAIFVPSGKLVSGARNWQPEIALIIGLMMTGFVVTYLLISLRRTLRLELLTKSLQEATRELRREGEKVTHLARTDFLTGLANRTLFSDKISAAAARLRRDGETFTVLFLDLDGFKHINDSLGHPAGDELLKEMALRLKSLLRETDVVARLGGDEFAIMRTGATNQREEAIDLARKVLSTVAKPFDFDGHNATVKTSIGIALAPENGTEPGELMKKADLALYRVKSEGRNNFSFFDEEMSEDATTRHRLLNDLRMALSRNEFELHYQPVIDAKTSRPCGAEALVRWRHTVEGLIFPDRFIWLAEESGLMEQLGEWILKRACTDAASWPENIKVAVNLSAAQFQSDKLFDVILCALVESGLPPERLELEVTESILLQNKENCGAMIQQLKNIGISIVLDDFGTGYSSLSDLTRFPFDKIKIDKSFTQGLSNRADCAAVVASVLTLARGLDIAVTAEGVETKQQFELLRAAGVNQLQGYLFGRPCPVAELDFSALERTGQAVEAA
jgi:diguanylate cyclase (GGDEF)-like protein